MKKTELTLAKELLQDLRRVYLYKEDISEKDKHELWVKVCDFIGDPERTAEEKALSFSQTSEGETAMLNSKTKTPPNYDYMRDNNKLSYKITSNYYDDK